jgi:uncharacterized protein YbbK (DUF523 family)
MKTPILVSACLLGLNTRYDGNSKPCAQVFNYLEQHNLLPIPICPEQLGGLATPRLPCSFTAGDGRAALNGEGVLCNEQGEIVTHKFITGAQQSLNIASITGCTKALLKQRSPSCGVNYVYQGINQIAGQGVTAALLAQHGFDIISEDDIENGDN